VSDSSQVKVGDVSTSTSASRRGLLFAMMNSFSHDSAKPLKTGTILY
jgi:hypothetical protein